MEHAEEREAFWNLFPNVIFCSCCKDSRMNFFGSSFVYSGSWWWRRIVRSFPYVFVHQLFHIPYYFRRFYYWYLATTGHIGFLVRTTNHFDAMRVVPVLAYPTYVSFGDGVRVLSIYCCVIPLSKIVRSPLHSIAKQPIIDCFREYGLLRLQSIFSYSTYAWKYYASR